MLPQFDETLRAFEIKSPLFRGLGGNGRIFLARAKVANGKIAENQEVAIKVPLVPGADFQKEMAVAEELQRLKPPGIVEIYDTALDDSGYYIIMEYLPGYDLLTEISTNGPMSIKEALEAIIDVCRALVVLHQYGIYHGDVKPENIVRSRSGNRKLVDFGLSQRFSEMESVSDEERRSAALRDVYQVGETMYYLLTGWLPFFARLESLARRSNLMNPCIGVPAAWNQPELAIRLGQIILQCLDLDQEARPDMLEVLAEFEACYQIWLEGPQTRRDELTSFGPWFTSSKARPIRATFTNLLGRVAQLQQNLLIARKGAPDTLVNIGTIYGILGHYREAEAAFRQAVQLEAESFEAWHNLGMTLMKQGALNEADVCFERALSLMPGAKPTLRAQRILVSTKTIIAAAIDWYREYAAEAPGDPYHVGNAYAALGLWDESIRQYFKALQKQPTNLKTRLQLANAYTSKGLIHEAVEELQAALILDPENTTAHTDLAANLRRIGEQGNALLHLQTALGMNPYFAPALLEIGLTHLDLAHNGNAQLAFERLARIEPSSQIGQFYLAYFAETDAERYERLSRAISLEPSFLPILEGVGKQGMLSILCEEKPDEEQRRVA